MSSTKRCVTTLFILVITFIFIFILRDVRQLLSHIHLEKANLLHTHVETLEQLQTHADILQLQQSENTKVGNQYQRINRGIATYDENFFTRLKALTLRKAKSLDPELIQFVREALDPPSTRGTLKTARQVVQTPQSREVEAIFKEKRGGYFIECGGFDGERSSNTLYLEKERGWTGVLIEMDPHFYTQLLGKNRRSWSLNACLSPHEYVIELPFIPSNGGRGKVTHSDENVNKKQSSDVQMVPCFPLETILAALNRTQVDYFSLDVEGLELQVLKTINLHKISIDVLSVEYVHTAGGKQAILDHMTEQGYRLHKEIDVKKPDIDLYVDDFIFVLY